ncbi:PadR family transcriptional regulator [Streptomyces lunaelactis]|uniref:PadR family transcriptional regulator n=1 Tax=Streptomyces lunaelactis TaxID=1535768 RepID=A0A2R4SXF7_9ACTN|nr:PadR family transcriptional regulator [Streptomyces lunaelactis]AVZ71561.1 PadR family transcriptional regulator [Streptomyces lunaelactis]NUK10660.1 PadR family transcriptional regulator [Streptomyces lunaelactis]NUK33401.1 PadR family transcriptional regulator [Streptomyces lunaelactis]NUK39979.1 PadR family transcriptional regulator [Streptomyces lunaelactis]NUK49592.1 PadR family transcriptional regulator [Streptomyces lunaelactis]
MSLKYAVLAALLEGESSGYDLAKRFDVSVANFWSATPQQLYRELERLAGDGLIAARVVQQERRPNKRMFTLTDTGRQDLRDFTAEPPRPTTIRDEFLVKIQAMDEGDPDATRNLLEERLEWARGKLARYERLRDHLLGGLSEEEYLRDAERIGPYLTLMRGRAFEEENLRWGEQVLEILARRKAVGGRG